MNNVIKWSIFSLFDSNNIASRALQVNSLHSGGPSNRGNVKTETYKWVMSEFSGE